MTTSVFDQYVKADILHYLSWRRDGLTYDMLEMMVHGARYMPDILGRVLAELIDSGDVYRRDGALHTTMPHTTATTVGAAPYPMCQFFVRNGPVCVKVGFERVDVPLRGPTAEQLSAGAQAAVALVEEMAACA